MFPFRSLIPLAFASLIVAPAHATILAEAAVRTSASGAITTPLCSDGGSGIAYATSTCSDAGNFGEGRASAQYGSIETYARLYAASPPADNHNYQAYGRASFSDQLSLSSDLIDPGVSTEARVVFDISGSVLDDGPTWMEPGDMFIPWTFTVKVNGLELQPSNGPLTLSGSFHYDFDISGGSTVSFSAELISDVRCHGCDVAYEGIADFWGTANVTAVEVRDPGTGEFLDPADFVITSLDGGSYANVVPEPSTALLLAGGLLALAARRRRR